MLIFIVELVLDIASSKPLKTYFVASSTLTP